VQFLLRLGRNMTIILHLAYFWNGLEYRNFDCSRLIGNNFSTSCKILVRFGSVTPRLKRKNLYGWRRKFITVQLHSLGGRAVRHWGDQYLGVFHKYSLGGNSTTPSGLYARFYHAFLVLRILCSIVLAMQIRYITVKIYISYPMSYTHWSMFYNIW